MEEIISFYDIRKFKRVIMIGKVVIMSELYCFEVRYWVVQGIFNWWLYFNFSNSVVIRYLFFDKNQHLNEQKTHLGVDLFALVDIIELNIVLYKRKGE